MLSPSSSLFWESNSCNKSLHWKDLLIYCIEFNIANLKEVSQKFTSGPFLFFWKGAGIFDEEMYFFPHPYTNVILLKLSCQNFRIEDLPEYKVLKCKALEAIRQKFSKKNPKKPKQKTPKKPIFNLLLLCQNGWRSETWHIGLKLPVMAQSNDLL